jgi:hypothetical protein
MEELSTEFRGMTMHVAADGGPIRFPITGRRNHTTHLHPSQKAGYLMIPSESYSEYRAMSVLDVSHSVIEYMAQPHRIETASWSYTPDIGALVTHSLIRELKKGIPFVLACLKLPPSRSANEPYEKLVLEVKRDLDREKPEYARKLSEASKLYALNGYHFHRVEETPGLDACDIGHFPSVMMDFSANVPERTTLVAWRHLIGRNGLSSYEATVDALGGGTSGIEAAHCLHGRGLIWIDLTKNPIADPRRTRVAMPPMLGNNRVLAERLLRGAR